MSLKQMAREHVDGLPECQLTGIPTSGMVRMQLAANKLARETFEAGARAFLEYARGKKLEHPTYGEFVYLADLEDWCKDEGKEK